MSGPTPSEAIDAKIAGLDDWRGETLGRLRALIHEADPEVEETVKWAKAANPLGVPVWEHAGIICTGEIYRDKVKFTFANGAALAVSIATCSSQPSARTGLTSTTSGPSGSASRRASASAIRREAKYWLSA